MFRLCLLFLFLCVSFSLRALEPGKEITQYNVKIWDMENGLPGNAVLAIQQTRDGYLWLGTQDGLVRFDGKDFESITQGRVPQLQGSEIRALCEDETGTLWIGTSSGGLAGFNKGEFNTYSDEEHNALSKISAIQYDRRGNLWIGSLSTGLTCLSNGKFTTYTTNQGLPNNQVNAIYKDGNGDLWVTTAAGIVKLLEPGVFHVYASKDVLPSSKVVSLYEKETDTLWIGTGDSYLFRLQKGKRTFYGPKQGILHQTVTCLYRDSMNNLWIGTDGGGLTRMSNGVFSTLPGGGVLADGSVSCIYEDREGSLWVGTLDGGLHRLIDGKFTTYTTTEGLSHDYIQFTYEDRAGNLWIGTKGGLDILSSTEKPDAVLTNILTTGQGLLNNSITCLFEDPSGYYWIGTWGGLFQFENRILNSFTGRHGVSLSDNRIKSILTDRRGNTWVGTENGLNLITFDKTSGKYTVTEKQGLPGKIVEFIFEDSREKVWIGTDKGLSRFPGGDILPGTEKKYFRCAYEDRGGVLWFGTGSGLMRLKEKEIAFFNLQYGLIENNIYSILEDGQGYLWLAGRNGISRVKKKELEDFSGEKIHRIQSVSYNEKDGMKSRWCTGIGCKTREGRLWFPTSIGVAAIDPNHIKKNNIPPPVIIKEIIADDAPVDIKGAARGKEPLKLDPGKKRLEFYYTAASFINPEKIKFKLKLDGYDRDWIDMGNARSTTYTHLSPGPYTFTVIAANADGVWNEKGASISFYLRPYFTQTPLFFVLVIFFGILVVILLHRLRVRQLKNREKELEKLVKQSTEDIEAKKQQLEVQTVQLREQSEKLKEMDKVKSRFFANISHEFRTPLTLIMGPIEKMLSETRDKEQKKELNLMLRNSQRLLGLINQLLELSKFESGKVKLQAGLQNVVPFLKGIAASFEILAEQREIDLRFQAAEEDIPLYFDPEKIEDVMSNLLINAVKFTPPGGKIRVRISKSFLGGNKTCFLQISVSDTGPGIARNQLTHIFDRFYQSDSTCVHHRKGSGIGLAIAKELVELHQGKIEVHSREGENSGTEFIIRLPMGKDHLKPGEIVEVPETFIHRPPPPGIPGDHLEDETEIESPAPSLPQNGKEIILVVEDNAEVREYIRGSLEPHYTVTEAADGQEGMQKAKEIIPDLIISDIMMPGIDGYELCNRLKKDIDTSHIPVVLLTAKASEESIVRGLETGADDYVTKPFNTKIMLVRIKNLIELRRQLQLSINREMSLQPVEMSVSQIDKEFIKELREVIDKNLSDPDFNVELLAKKLYMDRSTVYRKISALTGETPTDFIRSCRLKRAAELLRSNFGTVLEVAFEVGFSSANYFSKCFKKKFHQLPSTFKEIDG